MLQNHTDGLFMSQQKYAEDLLITASMENCSPVATPLPLQLDRVPDQEEEFSNPTYFRSLAGKLQYLTLTRPDIQFAVNYVCQKMHKPSVSDYNLLKRVLRYIKGTITMGISYQRNTDFVLRAYSDSDYANCIETRRSVGGFCTYLGQNLISWSSKKQPTVSKSSTEAEYRCMTDTASEIMWLSTIMREIGVPLPNTPELHCDNLSAVYLSANPAFHARTKHFAIDYHFVRERVALKTLIVKHIPGYQQIADIFTKPLPFDAFSRHRYKLGVDVPPTPSLRGNDNSSSQIRETGEPQGDTVSDKGRKVDQPNNKPKPNSKLTWVKRSLAAATSISSLPEASSQADKTRGKSVTPESSTTTIKLANRFSTLDDNCTD